VRTNSSQVGLFAVRLESGAISTTNIVYTLCRHAIGGRATCLRRSLVAASVPSPSRVCFLKIVNVTVYNLVRTEPTMHTAPSPVDEPTTYRLERPLDELVPAPAVARMRRLRSALMVGGAIGLIVFVVITLPANYVALGFDALLVAFLVTTSVLVFLRRRLALLTAFTTGMLLICDASFDVMTAGPHDLWESALTATLVELPLAVILITAAQRILRLTATRL
jgi:hypothetical protein